MTTGGTLFSGGELCGVGMRQAGIDHRWGIEINVDIAGVAQANGFNVMVADVLTVDPAQMEPVDCLHVSPECQRASTANQGAELNEEGTKETELDKAFGVKIAQFIDVIQPKIFTLENVFAYRNFQAFKTVCAALNRNGYMWDFDNLNAADYGVPQSRRRLILRAVRGGLLPNLPQAESWVGWFSAIQDLIPTLPESKFAKWQLERLPAEIKDTILVGINSNETSGAKVYQEAREPAQVVRVPSGGRILRAFVIGSHYGEPSNGTDDPRKPQLRIGDEPYFTVTASGGKHNDARAWLQHGRVVSMTPRALARFQSVPDSYVLPASNKLACTVIGNGVSCLLAEKIYRHLLEATNA